MINPFVLFLCACTGDGVSVGGNFYISVWYRASRLSFWHYQAEGAV